MDIKPIEVVSMIPKSQEASQLKAVEHQKTIDQQMAFNDKFNETIQHNSTQTVPTVKTDNPEYRYDAKEKGNNPYYAQQNKKRKKNGTNEKDSSEKNCSKHTGIDIRI